ncbi:THAP domain-containing protein 6 isoform X2 [Dicentrarchus labrax]|uniref:THAP domain-containing protein 6 isoform X2 n=1 Tax=Dicentrarchus labrax TaxID=13489 RepID=UPI0021F60568|nr:THAP domain-containing protein 6 isoform X2 [Dicentrarchus labrax]
MPDFCAAYGCSHERSIQTRSRGITFHRFPKDNSLKRQWELAVKREGFVAAERSLLCSEHFKPDDFDRTGQIVRLRHGVKPSVFNFPSHLQKQVPSRTTKASRTAEESLPVDLPQHFPEAEPYSNVDHNYALPASPTVLKAKLSEALARVESLEREKRNSMIRERRAKKNVHALLKDLRGKNLINEELKDRLECYSDLRVDLLWRISEGREFQRVGAATLKALSPKVP